MATVNFSELRPYLGDDVGLFIGKIKTGITLTGTCDGINKDFVFPAAHTPYMDVNNDGVVDKNDIEVYDDGVAVTVTAFVPDTRTATLSAAPAQASVMTGDCTEVMELFILQDFDLKSDREKKEWSRCRSVDKNIIYTGRTVELSASMLMADFEVVKLEFNASTKDMLNSPQVVRAFLVFFGRSAAEEDRAFYIERGDIIFDSLGKGKANDLVDFSAKITTQTGVKYGEMESYESLLGVYV